jgi:glycosyltransferase involved in cell wall biosynthesis
VYVAKAILHLVEASAEDRAAMGHRGREYVRQTLDYRRIAQAYIEAIEAA